MPADSLRDDLSPPHERHSLARKPVVRYRVLEPMAELDRKHPRLPLILALLARTTQSPTVVKPKRYPPAQSA